MVRMPHWPTPIGYKDIDLGLTRMLKALENLGTPHLNLPKVIHFAGTNGKGSTMAFLKAILNDAGYKCHQYSSPHLVEFNERIVLADKKIDDEFLYEILEEVRKACEGIENVTFFEGTTLAAILAFSKVNADYVLLETGLGGRLDATNVIPAPELSVITPIDLDHMEFLGNSIEEIAYEKACIMKPGCKAVIAKQDKLALEVIQKYAKEIGCETILADKIEDFAETEIGLKGKHQFINAATAKKCAEVLEIEEDCIRSGIGSTKWPARLEEVKGRKINKLLGNNFNIYLDGGHNPQAAKAIADFSRNNVAKNFAIVGMVNTKDAKNFAENIKGCFDKVICINIPEETLSADAKAITGFFEKGEYSESFEEALYKIKSEEEGNLYICGSLYLAGWVMNNWY